MHQFEKQKTLLELKAEYFLTVFNVLIAACFSIIIALWLSNDYLILTLKWKIIGTIFTIILSAILFKVMKFQLDLINKQIRTL